MSEQASAADAISGQGDAPPAEAPGSGNADNGAQAPWYGESEDMKSYVENKGWGAPTDVLTGYQNLEKILGDKANALTIPKEGDSEGWNNFYEKLGRPATVEGYELPESDADAKPIADWFAKTAHEMGLNKDQAHKFMNSWNEFADSTRTESEEAIAQKSETEFRQLRKEWGGAFEQNVQAGQMAAKAFGFTRDEVSKIESVLGTKATLERFAQMGRKIGEDGFQGNAPGSDTANFGLTPAAAKQQIADLQGDKEFTAAYLDSSHPNHKNAFEKMKRLNEAAYPDQ